MFIDIHAHAYRKPVPFVVKFCTVEELIKRYDELGIEGSTLPIVSPEIYLPQAMKIFWIWQNNIPTD